MKKLIYYFTLVFFIIACGGSDDNGGVMTDDTPIGMDDDVVSEEGSFDISIESTDISSFQIIELGIPNDIQLSQNTYQASFGSEEITVTLSENNSLSFMVPDIQSGNYNFIIDIGNKKGKLDFKLSQIEDVENVEEFLNQELFNPLNDSRDEANSALENPDILDEERTLIGQGNEFYNVAQQAFENLTSDEKQQLSKLLIANEITFVLDETTGKTSSKSIFDFEALDADAKKLVIAKIKLVAIIGTVTAVLLTPEPVITKVIAVLAGAYGVYKLWDVIRIRERIINRIFIPIENLLESISGKSSSTYSKSQDLNFTNDIPTNFTVNSKGRKIIRDDENHPDARIADAVKEINETDRKHNELKSKIDQLLNVVGSFFGLGDNRIQETSGLPESATEEIITVALENFFVENHPEEIEVSIVALDGNTLQLKFTSQSNEPKQFTANLIYNDGDFRTETALNINLEVDTNTGYWAGRMIMDNRVGLEPCQDDRDNDGELDYDADCGTGGCQSCSRALFGSSWGSSSNIEFTDSEIQSENNFRMRYTIGGSSTSTWISCYTAEINNNEDFNVNINHYAPDDWGIPGGATLQNISFTITEKSNGTMSGTWTGNVRVVNVHCLERCSGTWEVSYVDGIGDFCNRVPSNP
ncbi:hypothetical protein [Maribacter hydrothermalis]|uniref:Uncharacterized protein n=1 Tax=Maribacter hydrothermalis TaxID=1836467 RepID=A0A1B7Z8B8_9FLAO|nr:hypothetical protein [Maribacter hydrothermalis]APQ19055.1 hypothetical protein BTR34_17775 [Maribacter hydrothermalis]OBR38932.1 hypothetical protein A9200_04505 [Maribacter hydrothermalis]